MTRNSWLRLAVLAAAGTLTACAGELDDARTPTGSTSVVSSSDFSAIYTANTDQGTVSRLDRATNVVVEVEAGLEPVRVARIGDRVFATLRGERALAVFRDTGSTLELLQRVELGAEPYGVVADEKGRFLYVANQLTGTVVEIDAESLTVTQQWTVEGQPRFLALHPAGKHLYVGSVLGGGLTDINIKSGEVTALALPSVTGADPETFEAVTLTGRITGDLAVSPDGTTLAVPTLYVNNVSPVGPVDPDAIETSSDGYAGSDGTRRFNPAVVLVVTNQSGRLRTEYTDTLSLQGFADEQTVSGYPASATFSPSGEQLVLTVEGSDAAFVMQMPESIGTDRDQFGGGMGRATIAMDVGMGGGSSMGFANLTTITTGSAPRGVAFLDDEVVFVHQGFDHTVSELPFAQAAQLVDGSCCDGGGPGRDMAVSAELPGELVAAEPVAVSVEVLAADLVEGRKLFFSASDSRMALAGAGVSCATCHFDSRTDGLTWQFDIGPRQTPSLAGNVSARAPVTWTDAVPTVFDEVMLTSQGRMGGDGLSTTRAQKVAAYIDSTPLPDTENRGAMSDAVLRGEALFASAEVGCADCHRGATLADSKSYDMFGLEGVRTRSLNGVAATSPYLHDGSAPTLRSVLEAVRTGEMGDTSRLTTAQMDDLEEFLKSL